MALRTPTTVGGVYCCILKPHAAGIELSICARHAPCTMRARWCLSSTRVPTEMHHSEILQPMHRAGTICKPAATTVPNDVPQWRSAILPPMQSMLHAPCVQSAAAYLNLIRLPRCVMCDAAVHRLSLFMLGASRMSR